MPYSKLDLLEAAVQSLPYSKHIENIDLDSEDNAIRFTWRKNRLRLHTSGMVEVVGDGVLMSSDLALLAQQIINQQLLENERKKP